jgi:hypothetical protein
MIVIRQWVRGKIGGCLWTPVAGYPHDFMGVKIKSNDDRIKTAAVGVLLLARDRMARAQAVGLISAALDDLRNDYDGYKNDHPKRDMAEAKDGSMLTNAARRADYLKLVAAVEALLAKIAKNRTEFNSLLELDNYLAFNLRAFYLRAGEGDEAQRLESRV